MFITRVSKAVSLFAVLSCVSVSLGADERAQQYLKRSMVGDFRVNVVVILKQFKSTERGYRTVKIQKSVDGKRRETVLSPLHLRCELLDNGKTVQTYSPDEQMLVVQPSSPLGQDVDFRFPLILKNYNLKSEAGKKIAGRTTILVTASSKSNDQYDIRYYFDEKTNYPLSKEIAWTNGTVSVEYEALDIKFPSKIDPSVFTIDPAVGYETITYGEPKKSISAKEIEAKMRFTPIIPPNIPYGFQVQRMVLIDDPDWKALCLKLTDGLQSITAYEWVPVAGERIKTGEDRTIKIYNGLKIMLVSDVDSRIRNSIIRSFLVMGDREAPVMLTRIGI